MSAMSVDAQHCSYLTRPAVNASHVSVLQYSKYNTRYISVGTIFVFYTRNQNFTLLLCITVITVVVNLVLHNQLDYI